MIEFIKHINFFEWLKFYKTSEKDDFNKNYKLVDYLQSDGTQYIITPFYYDVGGVGTAPIYNIKCRCCINDNYSIFGIYRAFNLTGSSGKMRFYGYNDRQNLLTDISTGTELNNWELLDKNLYCNGIIQNSTPDYFNNVYGFGGGDNIYLFGRAGFDDNGGTCRISNFYVSAKNPDTETITEICDLVACIRKSDNKPGMYDKVSQTFLTNEGTGEFETPIQVYLFGNPPFTFNSNGDPLVDYTISGNAIQSGTPTPDSSVMPQGTGERTGNLFDKSQPTTLTNKYLLSNGEESSNAFGWAASAYIPVSGYYVTLTGVGGNLPSICAYDSSKQFVRGKNYGNSNRTTIDISDCSFVRFSYVPTVQGDNAMLNTGSTALPYEPFGVKIPISSANTTTPVYLGEVESTRQIKELVLTGKEAWQLWYGNYYSSVIDRKGAISTILCTHFINSNAQGISYESKSTSGLKIASAALPFVSDLSGLKEWLATQYAAGTPVTIWYVLAEPETGIVNEPLMKIGDYADTVSKAQAGVEIPTINGSNTLTVDTTLQPSEVSIVYKK